MPWYTFHDRMGWWCEKGEASGGGGGICKFCAFGSFRFPALAIRGFNGLVSGQQARVARREIFAKSGDGWEARFDTPKLAVRQMSFARKSPAWSRGEKSHIAIRMAPFAVGVRGSFRYYNLIHLNLWAGCKAELLISCREVWGDLYMIRAWESDSGVEVYLPLPRIRTYPKGLSLQGPIWRPPQNSHQEIGHWRALLSVLALQWGCPWPYAPRVSARRYS